LGIVSLPTLPCGDYDDGQRQYVLDDDGNQVHGVRLIPEEELAPALTIPADERRPS
jgi:hypothetical protein